MKIVSTILLSAMLLICLCACGDTGMSYEEYEKYTVMEEELEQYHRLDEYNILTEDDLSCWREAIMEKYGEDVAEDVIDMFYSNTHELYKNID